MIKLCVSARFSLPVALDPHKEARTAFPDERTFYDTTTGHVIVQRADEWIAVVPSPGSVIRGAGLFTGEAQPTGPALTRKDMEESLAAEIDRAQRRTQQTQPVKNGQQPAPPSDCPPPARPIKARGRV